MFAQWCPTLCDPMDCSPPGSSVLGDSPDKNSGVSSMPSFRGSCQPRDRIQVSHIAGGFFIVWATDTRILEWVAYPFSRGCISYDYLVWLRMTISEIMWDGAFSWVQAYGLDRYLSTVKVKEFIYLFSISDSSHSHYLEVGHSAHCSHSLPSQSLIILLKTCLWNQ